MIKSIQRYTIQFLAVLIVLIRSLPIFIKTWLEALNILELKRKSITNQIILITGGGNGLGRSLAIEFAKYENKCTIIIADIDLVAAQSVVEHLKMDFNVKAYAYHTDVSDYDSVMALYENVLRDIGYVDILVNNAGMITFISLREKEWSNIERIIKVNLNSHLLMTRIFIEDMIKRKSGHIVGVSSLAGTFSGPSLITYSATKHGVTGFMKCLSNEMFTDGHSDYIKTTLVCPYFIDTRREIKEYLHLPIPPLSCSKTANAIVDGILKEKDEVFVPKGMSLLKMFTLLPFKVYNNIIQNIYVTIKTDKFEASY